MLKAWEMSEMQCLSGACKGLFPLSLLTWYNLLGGAVTTLRRALWPCLGSCSKFWSPVSHTTNLLLCEVWVYTFFFLLILVFLTTCMLLPLTPAPLPSLFLPHPLSFSFFKRNSFIFFPDSKFLHQFNNLLKVYWSIAQLTSKLKQLLKNFEAL